MRRPFLLPLVPLYFAGYWLHALGMRIFRLRKGGCIPTLVVGNAVAGGSGKTPLIAALAVDLMQQGVPVAVLSRGYGRRGRGTLEVFQGDEPQQVGDEPLELKHQMPQTVVVVDGNRHRGLKWIQANHPEVAWVLLDDGLQHHRLRPDISLRLWHQKDWESTPFLLPAGNLRNWPIWPKADVEAITYANSKQNTAKRQLYSIPFVMETPICPISGKQIPLEQIAVGWTGLARPEGLMQAFPQVAWMVSKDHGLPGRQQLQELRRLQSKGHLLCTWKDYFRLGSNRMGFEKLAVVPLTPLKNSPGYQALFKKIMELCTKKLS